MQHNTTTSRRITLIALTLGLFITLSFTSAQVATATQPAQRSEPIDVRSFEKTLSDATQFNVLFTMALNGQLNRTKHIIKGTLVMQLAVDEPNQRSSFAITGDLLPRLAMVGSSGPDIGIGGGMKNMGVYNIGDSSFVYMDAFGKLCMKIDSYGGYGTDSDLVTRSFSSTGWFGSIRTGNDMTFSGEFVGEKKINGVQTKHYKLDAATIEKLNARNKDSGRVRGKLSNIDVWVSVTDKHIVRMTQHGSGVIDKLALRQNYAGKFAAQYDILAINTKININFPARCNKPTTLDSLLYDSLDLLP